MNLLEGGVAQPVLGEICVEEQSQSLLRKYQGPPSPDHVWFVGETEEGPWQRSSRGLSIETRPTHLSGSRHVVVFGRNRCRHFAPRTGLQRGQSSRRGVSCGRPFDQALSRCRLIRCAWAALCRRPFRCRIQVELALRGTSGRTVPGDFRMRRRRRSLPSDYAFAGDVHGYSVSVSLDGEGCDNVVSLPSTVEVLADPLVGPLASAEYCEGFSCCVRALSFSLEGGVGSPSYQWYDDAGAISGADVFELHAPGGRGGHHGLHVCGDAVRGELQLRDGWSVDRKSWRRLQFVEEPEEPGVVPWR